MRCICSRRGKIIRPPEELTSFDFFSGDNLQDVDIHGENLEFSDDVPDEFVGDMVDAPVAFSGGFDDAFVLENGQVLADDRLGLFEALPEVGNAGVLLLDEAENLETQRMAADFEFLGVSFDKLFGTTGLLDHVGQFITI